MPNFASIAGNWRPVAQRWVAVAGNWRPVFQRWVGVAGNWRPTIDGSVVAIPNIMLRAAGRRPLDELASAIISFLPSGILSTSYTSLGETITQLDDRWLVEGHSGENFEIRFFNQAGALALTPSGMDFGTWYSLAQTRSVRAVANAAGVLGGAGVGPVGGACLVQIRREGTTTVLAQATLSLSAVIYPTGSTGGIPPGRDRDHIFYPE